jgi:hypothetical protein
VLVIDLDGVAVRAAGFRAQATHLVRVEAEAPDKMLAGVGDAGSARTRRTFRLE